MRKSESEVQKRLSPAVLKFHETGRCSKTLMRVNILEIKADGSFIEEYKDKSIPVYPESAWQKHKVQER